MRSLGHVAGHTSGSPIGILRQFVDRPVKGGFVHLLMGMVGAEMAASAGLRVLSLFQRKSMGGVTAIAPFLDDMAPLAKSSPDFLRDTQVFSLNSHSIKRDGMAALPILFQLLRMTRPTFFRKNHGLLLSGRLVVNVAGHALNTLPGMLGFYPRLEKSGGYSLMAFHAKSRIDLRSFIDPAYARNPRKDQQRKENEPQDFKILFHFLNFHPSSGIPEG